MTACPIAGATAASVLVDLGFEAQALSSDTPAACLKASAARLSGPIVGILRLPDARTFVTPPDQPEQNLWYARDLPAMAKTLGAGTAAPAFVALEQMAGGGPPGCPLVQGAPAERPAQSTICSTPSPGSALPRPWPASMSPCSSAGGPTKMRYVSTRGEAPAIGFLDAVLAGLAPDGGLYVPQDWPELHRRPRWPPSTASPTRMWPPR